MTIGISSTIGATTGNSLRLSSLNTQLVDLQRQLATQRQHDTLSGFGNDAFRIQDLRTEAQRLTTFQGNISRAETRTSFVLESTQRIQDVANQVQDTILLQTREGEVNIQDIQNIAEVNLEFLVDLFNTQDGDRFVFAGSDGSNAPLEGIQELVNTLGVEVQDWLAGNQTLADLTNTIDTLTDDALGFSSTLSSAGQSTIRIDDNVEFDYTVFANDEGFKNILKGVALSQALEFPDPATDIPDAGEFHDLLDYTSGLLGSGVEGARSQGFRIGAEFQLLENVREQNTFELNIAESLITDLEVVDTVEVVGQIQSLQTQLSASFQVTSIVSQLSLVNFL